MSKSRGNTLDPIELFDKYGADVVRFYSLFVSPPWIPTKFDVDGLVEVQSQFFRSFRNTYNFFQMYSETDNIDPREFFVEYEKRPEIDRWILSKYNNNPPPKMNEQDINEFIKEVGRKVGINEKVISNYTKGGVQKADAIMKYKLIGTHTARRSFCTNMYRKGMAIYDIMHFSGHSTEREFYKYIRIEKEQKAIKIAQSGFFNLSK